MGGFPQPRLLDVKPDREVLHPDQRGRVHLGGVLHAPLAHQLRRAIFQHGQGGADRVSLARHLAKARDRRQQGLGIGMLGVGEDLFDRAFLDLAALPHDHHVIGDFGDHAHIVGDEDDGHAQFGLQIAQDRQDLRLNGHIQRRGWFIRDQQLGAAGKRHGDHHPLAHPAGQLVRIAVQHPLGVGQAHQRQQTLGLGQGVGLGSALVQDQHLGDLVADGEDRVQRGHRFLKDHADLVAANVAGLILTDRQQVDIAVLALEHDPAAGELRPRQICQPHDRQRGHAFARPAFADDGDGAALRRVEAEIVNDRIGPKGHAEVFHRQKRGAGCLRHRHPCWPRRGRGDCCPVVRQGDGCVAAP